MNCISENSLYKENLRSIFPYLTVTNISVLVTGATGLIGSCIIDALLLANKELNTNYKVYALGRDKTKILKRFDNSSDLNIILQDITIPLDGSLHFDYIIHCASNADPKTYALYPVETILTNILGGKNILEYCKSHKTRVLLASTFEVYGKLEQDYYSETDYGIVDLELIRSCYPESKRTSEILFKSYHDEYGVDFVTARLSSIYGPTMKMDDSKAHAQFLRNALDCKDIVLKSEGKQRRSYCYLMDAVSGLFAILFNGKSGEAYNVANNNSVVTISELAHFIAEICGTKVSYSLPDDIENKGFSKPQNCILLTEKIQSLGWSGIFSLKQGLENTISILRSIV